jgi:hypothetical protein
MAGAASLHGTFAAAVLVFATTADDAVWLPPYLLSPGLSRSARVTHGLAFVAALQATVWASAAVSAALGAGVTAAPVHVLGLSPDEALAAIGALLCWTLALALWIKARRKAQRRRERDRQRQLEAVAARYGAIGETNGEGWLGDAEAALEGERQALRTSATKAPSEPVQLVEASAATPLQVFALAIIGALDEASYFPALLMAKTFTAAELAMGAALACLAIMLALTLLKRLCRPAVDCFDRVPLYLVVTVFALLLSVQLAADLLGGAAP